jgi:glycosyltransferase involved in cell wall biosynthesis
VAVTKAATDQPDLSVVIPVYNEVATLATILERVHAVPIDKQIIVVDDGSTDGSRELLAALAEARPDDPRLRVILHERNQGKTAALRTGFREAIGRVVIVQDADLEYDPRDYPKLVQPILAGDADVVYGSRFQGSPRRVLMFWHTLGNRLLTLLSNVFTNLNLTDMETCYKAFRSDVIKGLEIHSSGFGFEAEVTVKVAKLGCRLYEVPIAYHGRQYWEGKKITWRDGFHAVAVTLRYALFADASDDPGRVALSRVDGLRRYNRFLWDQMRPWVGRRVLEVGSGTGGITRYLVNRERVVASDPSPDYRRVLGQMFENQPNVTVRAFTLGQAGSELAGERFDTVVCSNVLEHVEDDVGALRQIHGLLEEGGRVVLVVPMLAALYGGIDRGLEHKRRYERAELIEKLGKAGFQVERLAPMNALGVPGWWLNSRLLDRRTVPAFQARINDWLVPLVRLEQKLGLSFGMSLLAIGRRV